MPLRLRDLDAKFLRRDDSDHFTFVETIGEADGVEFLCPLCFKNNGGSSGTHAVICWAPKVPQDTLPVPGRWDLQGTGLDDLTLVAASSSILIKGGCGAHFFVRNGEITGI